MIQNENLKKRCKLTTKYSLLHIIQIYATYTHTYTCLYLYNKYSRFIVKGLLLTSRPIVIRNIAKENIFDPIHDNPLDVKFSSGNCLNLYTTHHIFYRVSYMVHHKTTAIQHKMQTTKWIRSWLQAEGKNQKEYAKICSSTQKPYKVEGYL